VGKDALAKWAHSISPNSEGPFIHINCAAIHDSLWESEIFGHVKGAFTGAINDKQGQVEGAQDGTLFLNEIGDMPLSTQAKLLTFLDTRESQRVGETERRVVTTRVVAATNRDLVSAIESGGFRQDLFYRLAEVHVRVSPLRERPADVLALSNMFLGELGRDSQSGRLEFDDSTRELLLNHSWKGNVRELRAVLQTAIDRCAEAGSRVLTHEHFYPELCESGHQDNGQDNYEDIPRGQGGSLPDASPAERHLFALEDGKGVISHIDAFPENRDYMMAFLDQFKAPSGRWNLSAAHRHLIQHGSIKIGRRAFSKRIRQMFPDSEELSLLEEPKTEGSNVSTSGERQ
jgi:transcriptional regulator with GAF, ATPase, and Fis domain